MKFGTLALVTACLAVLCTVSPSQTYKVNQGANPQPENEKQPQKTTKPQTNTKPHQQTPEKSLGWGSNIQTARLGRAAESALKNGNYGAALDYAQKAAQSAPSDPKLWFLLGYAARLAGKAQVSFDAYDQGLRIDPGSLEGLSGLAQTYARFGKKDEAEKLLNRVLAANPKRANDQQLLGEILLQDGQYRESLGPLQRSEQLNPEPRSELLLALAHERMKEYEAAKRYLEMAKRRSPNNPEVNRSFAAYYRETGNYAAAIAALKSIRGATPQIKAELGYTYQLSGNQEEAAKVYVEAADAAPKDINLQLSAAQAQLGAGAIGPAKGRLKLAAGLEPDHYRLHALEGEVARIEERDQDAIREYNAAVQNLPQSPPEGPLYGVQLQLNLVQLYQRTHDESASKSYLETAQSQINQMNPTGRGREDYLRIRALIKLYAGDSDGALQDIHEALALDPNDINSLQVNGDVLVKLGRDEEAVKVYKKVLAKDPDNQLALTSLGSVSRGLGRDKDAEAYFLKLATAHPKYYVPHLSLGDMYTSDREFAKAQAEYRKAHSLAPSNSLVIAGGMNAAIEGHQFPLAAEWLGKATPEMQRDRQVLREKERYLMWTGKYQESADVAREAIKALPQDRDVVVYLGYDLLHLEKYDDLLALTNEYENRLPKDPALPLLAGYVHKHNGDSEKAEAAFTRAIQRDPKVATAYVNRGYVLHDQRKGSAAIKDFATALKIDPNNGEAHLGYAYASLDMQQPRPALTHAKLAEKYMGDSIALHLIRGTAYGQEGIPRKAVAEYRLAVKSDPNNGKLRLALAHTLFDMREYQQAIAELQVAQNLLPDEGMVYAEMARCYGQLGDRDNTMKYIGLAERQPNSEIYFDTGDALSRLGEQDAALERFERALTASDSDRISVRLAVGRSMLSRGETEDARRQVALALMESASGKAPPPTGVQLLQAAELFVAMHDYQLAETYFQRALAAGASETSVRVGLANTYLALGDTTRADAQLNLVGNGLAEDDSTYQYLLARANVYRQRRQNSQALTAFARAADAAGEDDSADREMLRAGGDEGWQINRHLSLLSDYSLSPIFEDTTIYALDAAFAAASPGTFPPPRSSLENRWTTAYHLHFLGLPDAGGFFQIRNARGQISLPSANLIVNRDTWDYTWNFGVNPTLHWGNNVFNFSTGIQQTIRRDSSDPLHMNQNLFRPYVYLSTSSFFNWVSLRGYALRESGPFTESNLKSRDLSGAIEFRVGRPWGKTGFITGWGARDEQFSPIIRENYYTSTYAGIEQVVSQRFRFRAVGEYLRAWRVENSNFAIAQAFRPAGNVEVELTNNWAITASGAYSRNMGFHAYDAFETGFSVSYALPIHRTLEDNGHPLNVRYPIRFSAGMQQQTFFNFNSGSHQQFRPYVQISIF